MSQLGEAMVGQAVTGARIGSGSPRQGPAKPHEGVVAHRDSSRLGLLWGRAAIDMIFDGRVRVPWGLSERCLVLRHDLRTNERVDSEASRDAASRLDRWCDDPTLWPSLLELSEILGVETSRPPTTQTVVEVIKPALRWALDSGRLVVVRLEKENQGEAPDDGVVHQGSLLEGAAEQLKDVPRLIRQLKEKSFLDVRLTKASGAPFSGRKYKLQLPNGLIEKSVLGADGRISKSNIEPGTALLTLADAAGDGIEAQDHSPKAISETALALSLVDEDGAPVGGIPFRVVLADGSSVEGTLDAAGAAHLDGLHPGDCTVHFPTLDKRQFKSV